MKRISLVILALYASACAVLTSASDELSACNVSDECGCEQHCGVAPSGGRACLDGCENDEDCSSSGLGARCSKAFQVCDRGSGRCVDDCNGNEIRCGLSCCFGANPTCLGEGESATCCPSGFSCGSECCQSGEPFFRCGASGCERT